MQTQKFNTDLLVHTPVVKLSWSADQFFQRYDPNCQKMPSRNVEEHFKNSQTWIRRRMTSKIYEVLQSKQTHLWWNFHKDPIGSSHTEVANRQTDKMCDKDMNEIMSYMCIYIYMCTQHVCTYKCYGHYWSGFQIAINWRTYVRLLQKFSTYRSLCRTYCTNQADSSCTARIYLGLFVMSLPEWRKSRSTLQPIFATACSPLRDLPLRAPLQSVVYLQHPLTALLHQIFGLLCFIFLSVLCSAHILWSVTKCTAAASNQDSLLRPMYEINSDRY